MNSINWKFFTPLALAGLVITAIAEKLVTEYSLNRIFVHLGSSALLFMIVFIILGRYARARRRELKDLAIRGSEVSAVESQS